MKENESYSIRNQSSSNPHKIRGSNAIPSAKPAPPNPQPTPVVQPQSHNDNFQPQPTPVAAHEIGQTKSVQPPPQNNQEEAIALARSKLAAIFGQEEQLAEPGQAQEISAGYNQEQVIQTQIDPTHPPVQPDHELPAPNPENYPPPVPQANTKSNQYGSYIVPGQNPEPGLSDATNRPAPESKLEPQKPKLKRKRPDLKKANAMAKKGRDNLKNLKHKIASKKRALEEEATHKDYTKASKPLWKRYAPLATIVMIVVLILNNQLVYGQISYYITPGNREDLPKITEPTADMSAPAGSRIVIPKINVNVPVNYSVDSTEEKAIQAGLEDGVVHYSLSSAKPGQVGNNVILGHNTNNFWDSGKYKTAFVLLDRLEEGDTFELHYKKKKYIYELYEKKVIEPDDFSVVEQKVTEPIVTLITCHPPGTSWQRLIVQARQISPEPNKATEPQGKDLPEGLEGNVPGNAPSVWESLTGWLI